MTSDKSNSKRLLIAAGGTGGHIFPALAVFEVLKQRYPELEMKWIGSSHRMESRLIPSKGLDFIPIKQTEIKRGASAGNFIYNIRSMILLNKAIGECKKIIQNFKPNLLLSTGGFAAGAAGLASGLTGVPLAIIEPNAYPGLTNRKLGASARMIFTSYESAAEFFPKDRIFNFGTPTRTEVVNKDRNEARKQLEIEDDTIFVVATGGSQGADSININVPFGILQMVREYEDIKIKVIHQAGKGRIDEARVFREELPDDIYEVVEFIDDMPTVLAAADIIISRAGAGSLAEIAVRGIPAILFPYPKAAENHQYKNAKQWADAGAAILLEDGSTNIGDISKSLSMLFYDPELRKKMGNAARQFGKPDSAQKIADKLETFFKS